MLDDDKLAAGPGGVIPNRVTVCGLPTALSATLRTAVRFPKADGVNLTLSWQLVAAARVVPQLFVWLKSVAFGPMIEIADKLTEIVPVLLSVTTCEALVEPTSVCGNAKPTGNALATRNEPCKKIKSEAGRGGSVVMTTAMSALPSPLKSAIASAVGIAGADGIGRSVAD